MRAHVLILAAALLAPAVASAHETRTMTLPDGIKIPYLLALPNGYDPAKKYEALLAFPGGTQAIEKAAGSMERFWETEATRRGVIVVLAAAPSIGRPYFTGEGSVALIPDIVTAMRATYSIKDGPIHVGGHSNGGITAFRAAIRWPELFSSLTAIAGIPFEEPDISNFDHLKGMKISLFVGSNDVDWRQPVSYVHLVLEEMGIPNALTVVPRSGHSLEAMSFEKSGPVFDTVVPAASN